MPDNPDELLGHPEDGGPKVIQRHELTYGDYLKVDQLLDLQVLLSDPPHHDETLFIVIHQTFELWFKQIKHELEAAMAAMDRDEALQAHQSMRRVVRIMHVLVGQVNVLETMATVEFLAFRDNLNPASGFQSIQFREIEFMAGLKSERYLDVFRFRPDYQETLRRRLAGPDLRSCFFGLLRRQGYAVPEDEDEAHREALLEALTRLYQRPDDNLRVYLLSESLMDFDEALVHWRNHHVLMVERIIGLRPGTGGSAGVRYLESTTSKRCFPLLWEVRTRLKKA
ncbi:MAG: tryptophan 2,3-dioxygenase family protein [Candidatus Eremiobacterota bacterium]